MFRTLYINVLLFSYLNAPAQVDYSKYVVPIYKGKESTALSIYDANPESPNGAYICFIKYPKIAEGGHLAPPVTAAVMIKNRKTGKTRKIYEVACNNHNGANALWINDSLVAFQVHHFKDFVVYNIHSKQSVFGLVAGELGHKSFGNILYISLCNARLLIPDSTRTPYDRAQEGIYSFDGITGEKKQIVQKADLVQAFQAQNPAVTANEAKILHVEPNPDNDKIMFDYRYQSYPNESWEELHGFMDADGSGIRWVKERPMHVVWFDNNTMFGVDTSDPEKKIYQYDLYGKKLQMLGGTSTHVGTSPEREWYVGESAYYQSEEDGFTRVYLYKRGVKEPYALLAEWNNAKITWTWVAHVNPSFSTDGKRAYFIRASHTKDKFEAVSINLADLNLP